MSIASRAPQSRASQLHGVLAGDGSRPLLVAANAAGALCIVTSIFGWGGLGDHLLLDSLAFESLIVLSTAAVHPVGAGPAWPLAAPVAPRGRTLAVLLGV